MAGWLNWFRPKGPPTWSVHMTANDPAPLLCAVAAHYLCLGAIEVHICLDRTDPEAVALLASDKRVRVTVCDAEYWAASRHGARPLKHLERQIYNANLSYRQSKADWFLVVDADEFLALDCDLTGILAKADPKMDFLRFSVIERAFRLDGPKVSIFDGVFRRPARPGQIKPSELYAGYDGHFTRGILGHLSGKAISRTRRDLRIWLHFPKKSGDKRTWDEVGNDPRYQNVPENFIKGAALVHYYALTPLHLVLKRLAEMMVFQEVKPGLGQTSLPAQSSGRKHQFKTVYENRTDAAVLRDLARIIYLDDEQISVLDKVGLLTSVPFDAVADAKAIYPDAPFDYSHAEFDRLLVQAQAELIRKTDFPVKAFLEG